MSDWKVAPTLGTADVAALADFFCEKLGFTRPNEMFGEPGSPPVYAIVTRGGIDVHIQIRHGGVFPAGERGVHDGEAYFVVEGVDALAADFAAKGVSFLRGLIDEPYGLRDFTVETAEGHRLTFGTPR